MIVEFDIVDVLGSENKKKGEKVWINLNFLEKVVPYRSGSNIVVIYTVSNSRYYVELAQWEEVVTMLRSGKSEKI